MNRIAVYAGSFDPITLGHENLIHRASKMYDELIIAIGVNSSKKPLFTDEQRLEMVHYFTMKHFRSGVKVMTFEGLLVNFVRKVESTVIVRGLRAVTDFEYEMALAHANGTQEEDIETVFLATKPELAFISSTIVKEIAKYQGDVRRYVNPFVEAQLRSKFAPRPEK